MFIARSHHLSMNEFDVPAFGEFTKGRHGEPMAMLPTLPLEKNNWTFWQSCQKVPWATCYFEPLLATLPEALWRISVFLYEMKRNDAITYRSAVLPNHVPGPAFLRRISASWRLAHPLCGHGLLCRSCIKLDGHLVFSSGCPPMTFSKTKEGSR